ncbi:MAG TPA: hypothetical protein VLW85_15770 [Myxococcales bacterium]|nr:hypothetical protein [Myxococcales bacterium]
MLLLIALLLAEPLADANAQFRALYREAKSRALAAAGQVVLIEGDTLVVRDGAQRQAVRFLPEKYTKLKEVSHVPLAIFVALHGEPVLGAPARKALESLVADVRAAGQRDPVLDASLAFAGGVLQRGQCSEAELDAFARKMGPLVSANADEAAAAELDALDKTFDKLTLRPGFHVVVMGAHMARTNEISLQYFEQRLHEREEGGRVIYAEGVWDEEKALELLATHLLDGAAAQAFFGDAARLHQDMLAEGAKKYLLAHPAK